MSYSFLFFICIDKVNFANAFNIFIKSSKFVVTNDAESVNVLVELMDLLSNAIHLLFQLGVHFNVVCLCFLLVLVNKVKIILRVAWRCKRVMLVVTRFSLRFFLFFELDNFIGRFLVFQNNLLLKNSFDGDLQILLISCMAWSFDLICNLRILNKNLF